MAKYTYLFQRKTRKWKKKFKDGWSKRKTTSNTLLLSKSLSIRILNINILHSQNTKSGIVCNTQPNYMLPTRNPIKYKDTEIKI